MGQDAAGKALVKIVQHQVDRQTKFTQSVRDECEDCFAAPGDEFWYHHKQAARIAAKAKSLDILRFLNKDDRLIQELEDILPLRLQAQGAQYEEQEDLTDYQYLLDNGAQVNGADEDDNTAIFYACVHGRPKLFELLVDSGADTTLRFRPPTPYPRGSDLTPLPELDQEGKAILLQITAFAIDDSYMSSNSFDLGYKYWGVILIFLLQRMSSRISRQLLVDYMAAAAGRGYEQAIHTVATRHHSEQDLAPSLRAAAENGQTRIVELLLALGANPRLSIPDPYSRRRQHATELTPVQAALQEPYFRLKMADYFPACELLYEAGIEESDRTNLLHAAGERGKLELVQRLWKDGVRIDLVPAGTPLEVCEFFSSQGLEPDWTAMQTHAFQTSNVELLDRLVRIAGAQLRNNEGLERGIRDWYHTLTASQGAMITYLIERYSHHSPHKDVFERLLWGMPTRFLRSFLMGAMRSGCPGIKQAALIELQSHKPDPGKRWNVGIEYHQEVMGFQLLVRCVEDTLEEVTNDDDLWLAPNALREWLEDDNRQKISSLAQPVPERLHTWRVNEHLLVEQDTGLESARSDPYIDIATIHTSPTQETEPPNEYTYETLQDHSIRLLTIEPGDAEICCTMSHHRIASAPQYEALSYVWGEVQASTITVNNTPMTVRPNLVAALKRLRLDRPRVLWIDAACINQQDLKEKAQQVRMMRYIFSSATQVLIWLGQADADSHKVFEYINNWKPPPSRRTGWDDGEVAQPHYEGDIRDAYIRLCARPWFFRTWTMQEFALSKKAVVYCGQESADWKALVRASSWRFEHFSISGGVHTESRVRTLTNNQGSANSTDTMQYALMCRATDHRDKVYGLLGLLDYNIVVDYDLSVEELYIRFAKEIIKHQRGLRMLHTYTSRKLLLPSWVPDLSISSTLGSMMGFHGIPSYPHEKKVLLEQLQDSFSFEGSRMNIKGVRLGVVKHVAPVLRTLNSDTYVGTFKSWEQLAMKEATTPMPLSFFLTLDCEKSTGIWHSIAGAQWHEEYCSGVLKERYPQFWITCDVLLRWKHDASNSPFGSAANFASTVAEHCYGRCLFVTTDGRLGLGHESTQAGDEVVYFHGSDEPFALRDNGRTYTLKGGCFLNGFLWYNLPNEAIRNAGNYVLV